jgi:hypothetical protein
MQAARSSSIVSDREVMDMQTQTRAKAAIGYGVYRVAKPLARRAVKTRTRRLRQASRRAAPFAAAFAAIAAAIAGALFFWRRRSS